MNLNDLGIVNGSLCEVIVTTFHADRSPNAAPMGVFGVSGDEFILRAHNDTDTCENILRTRCCVINLVYDPLLFLRCSLAGKHKGSGEVETQRVKRAGTVDAPYLLDAQAYVEAELKEVENVEVNDHLGKSTRSILTLKVRGITVLEEAPVAPNRGFFAGVELAISLSRGQTGDVVRLMGIIKKTLPSAEVRRIEEFLKSYLTFKP